MRKCNGGIRPLAADFGAPCKGRQGKYESTLQPHYVRSKNIDFGHGTKIEVDDDLGFGFGYNFTNNIALNLDWSWASSNYRAKIATTDSGGNSTGTTTVGGSLDTATVMLNLSYYFLDGLVTPFVMVGPGGPASTPTSLPARRKAPAGGIPGTAASARSTRIPAPGTSSRTAWGSAVITGGWLDIGFMF